MKKTWRNVISFLLVAVITLATLPVNAITANAGGEDPYVELDTCTVDKLTYTSGPITIKGVLCTANGLRIDNDRTITISAAEGHTILKIEATVGYSTDNYVQESHIYTSKGQTSVPYVAVGEDLTIYDINASSVTLSNLNGSLFNLKHFKVYYTPAHTGTLVSGQAANCTYDGWKNAYKCEVCGLYYEDSALTTEIGDADAYEAWKTGDGKIAAGHDYKYEKAGLNIFEKCSRCTYTKTITLEPVDAVYNGEPYEATYSNSTTLTDNDITLSYQKKNGDNWDTVVSAIEVGTYKVSLTAGGATTSKEFTISKAQVEIPTAITGLVYNGSYQVGVNYTDSGIYTVSGTTKMDYAGTYKAIARLNDSNNYEWADGTTSNKTIEWSIATADYKITKGADGKLTTDALADYSITGNGAYDDFIDLIIDDEYVDPDYYTVASGSTVITLKASYLETLSVGKHDVVMKWKGGTASTTLTVAEPDDPLSGNDGNDGNDGVDPTNPTDPPKTADNSPIVLWTMMLALAGGATITIARKKEQDVASQY